MRFSSARFVVAALGLTAALGLVAPHAQATEEDAKAFFAEGRKFRLEGKCDQAIIPFRRAMDIYPEGIGALRNIAECEEELKLYASARVDYWSLRRAALQSTEAKYAGWDKSAEEGYNRLASKVAKVTIVLHGEALDRVRVTIDGKPLDPRLIGVEIERDLGAHTFSASYGGATSLAQKRTLGEGAKEAITFEVPSLKETEQQLAEAKAKGLPIETAAPVAPPPPTSHSTTVETDDPSRRNARIAGGVAFGVGGAALVGAVITGLIRNSSLNSIKTGCPTYPNNCDASLSSKNSTGQTTAILTDVLGGVAIVGVGLGAGFMIYGFSKPGTTVTTTTTGSKKIPTTATLGFLPVPSGAGSQLTLRF